MTHTDFFIKATLALACKAFDSYPEYGTGHEPFKPFKNDDERESFDPDDEANPSKQIAWTRRVVWAAEDLAKFIGRNYPSIFDPEFSLS